MKQRFSKRTRLVSALLTLAMVFTFLPFSAFAAGGTHAGSTIELSSYYFPDEAFREYLEQFAGTDKKLHPTERNGVTEIKVAGGYNGKKITNLKGIEFFPNLVTLWCYDNQLTELDVSKNPELKELWCTNNKLTSLDVSKNTELKELLCNNNLLDSLDVSKNSELKELRCSNNPLNSLDVSKNKNLETLYCSQNQLTSLDVTRNTVLTDLSCTNNPLASLDVSKNTELKYLYCYENQLTSLDVSKNTQLITLFCRENNLTSLNVENTSIDRSNSASWFETQNNTYPIAVGSNRAFDLSKLPGKFDVTKADNWVGGTEKDNILTVNEGVNQVTYTYDCGKGLSETFTLNVNVVPDGTVTPPTGGGSTGGSSGGGGGGAIIVVAGAAAVGLVGYGIYNYVAERQLQALLPEGAASPENRAQTALLLWNTAGRPEPAAQPAFPDVADPETAKAAQWCVEQGLMNLKFRGRFAPDGSSPAYKTLNAYRQLVG